MIIDFKEIPIASKGGGEQDRFEQFACDFLEAIGNKILMQLWPSAKSMNIHFTAMSGMT